MSQTGEGLAPRKPRIALMGEFSAGKSTLSNLLLGARPLPESVTATCLSPVWIAKGTPGAMRECLDGTMEPVSMADLHSVPLEGTRVIHLSFESDMLDECDLIDCPGISDPNMPAEVWERIVPEFDAVLWCTHATQAWRQSEAAVWEGIPEAVRARSLLLVTRFDKLTTERDRMRVLARVKKETEGLFAGIYPVSLLRALEANGDEVEWQESGAHDFALRLNALIGEMQAAIAAAPAGEMNPSRRSVPDQPRPETPDLSAFSDEAPATGRASLFDMAFDEPTSPATSPASSYEVQGTEDLHGHSEPIPTRPEPSALAALAELKSAVTEEQSLGMDSPRKAATLGDALDAAQERPARIRPLTLEKERPVPAPMEAPQEAAKPEGPVKPRRVARPDGMKTERPRRERPVAKNPSFGATTTGSEPTLTDLRSAFSGE